MGVDIAVEVSPRDFRGNMMEDECGIYGVELGIHRHILPDEGGGFKTTKTSFLLFYFSIVMAKARYEFIGMSLGWESDT